MLSFYELACQRVALALGVEPYFVRWEHVEALRASACVLHFPWSRVVVARSTSGVDRFVERYLDGECSWLMDSVEALYPIESTPLLPPPRLAELPVFPELKGFRKWALSAPRNVGWPVSPTQVVVGSWTTFMDAILVRHADGTCGIRERAPKSGEDDYGRKRKPKRSSHQERPTA